MNEEIRKRLVIQPPKTYHLTFESAAEAWGDEILPGLQLYQDKGDQHA